MLEVHSRSHLHNLHQLLLSYFWLLLSLLKLMSHLQGIYCLGLPYLRPKLYLKEQYLP
jgi:hypothetical protein